VSIAGSRVGVIGGSIAGCAAAIALGRLGCEVEVFERSSGALRDRGAGIAIPVPLRDELTETGYLPASYPTESPTARLWVLADGSHDGRVLWQQGSRAAMNNWGVLWRSLRAAADGARYHEGVTVEHIETEGESGASVRLTDGTTHPFDVVIGADGYRSIAHQAISSGSRPEFAGYVLWRGNYLEADLGSRDGLDRLEARGAWLTVCFDGGHGVMYMIPDLERGSQGVRQVNWAIYTPAPAGLDFSEPTSIPPGQVDAATFAQLEALLDRSFPALYRPLFESPASEVSIQPIYDQLAETYVQGRVALIGDAGTVTRPHTGSGATKAIQDALTLARLGDEHDDWAALLAAYDLDRTATGRSLVGLGRRIGHAQVEATPAWADMSPDDFEAWTAATLSGEKVYFYGDPPERAVVSASR